VNGLAIHAFPEGGAFIVGEGVEEGFPEGDFGVEGRCGCGIWRWFAPFTAVVVMMPVVMPVGSIGIGGGRAGAGAGVLGRGLFEAEFGGGGALVGGG